MCSYDHCLRVRFTTIVFVGPDLIILRNAINALSFSYDGEYLAIASGGAYIDIVSYTSFSRLVDGVFLNSLVCYRDWCSSTSRSRTSTLSNCYMAPFKIRNCLLWPNKS
jgi:hypothetical protein